MNGVCHCEWERPGGKVFKGNDVNFGVKMAGKGAEGDVKQTVESSLENLIKMCNFCRCSLFFGQG